MTCTFESDVVTRFLSRRADPKARSAGGQRRRQGDTAGLKDLARHPGSLTAKDVTLSAYGGLHFDHVVQIADDVGPLQRPLLPQQSVLQFLAQQQRQERTEHVPANRLVALMMDRPRIQQRL